MERKTKVHAEDGKQDLTITREFVQGLYRSRYFSAMDGHQSAEARKQTIWRLRV